MCPSGDIRRLLALLLAAALAVGLSLSHVAHAASPAGAHATAAHHHHGHADHAPEERAGHKAALCCFVVAQAPSFGRAPAVRAAPAVPRTRAAAGLSRAPTPPPPRSS